MKIGKESIKTSVVAYINILERIHIDSGVFKDLTMILTGYIIHDFLLIETSSEQRMIEEEKISNDLLVYYQKCLNLTPIVQDQFVPILKDQYHCTISLLDRIKQ